MFLVHLNRQKLNILGNENSEHIQNDIVVNFNDVIKSTHLPSSLTPLFETVQIIVCFCYMYLPGVIIKQ